MNKIHDCKGKCVDKCDTCAYAKRKNMEKKAHYDLVYEAAFTNELEKISGCKSHGKVKLKKAKKMSY